MERKPTSMKICIWGAGDKGKRIFQHMEPEDILCFVDSDQKKTGSNYLGKKVICVEQYCKEFRDHFILLSHMERVEEIEKRMQVNIQNYFYLSDCPGELQEPNTRNLLKNYVETYLNDRSDYALYGFSLYSIFIDRWIYNLCGRHPYVILPKDADLPRKTDIQREFPSLNIINLEDAADHGVKEICNVMYQGLGPTNGYKITGLYDCSDKITEYRNEEIATYQNQFDGQSCFIVATGPSLRADDLELLRRNKCLSFSVNTIYKIYGQTKWRPDFYVADDYRAIEKYREVTEKVAQRAVFIGDTKQLTEQEKQCKDIYWHHIQHESYTDRFPKFSEDYARKCYLGYTVVYSCIQLAVYMGFREIYLLGTDCNYVMGSKNNYFWPSEEKDVFNHEMDKIFLGYQAAKKYADSHGIKIWNATRGGKLEIFERVSLEEVFRESRKDR